MMRIRRLAVCKRVRSAGAFFWAAVMLLLPIVCSGDGARAGAPTEYQLKAALLLNFAKFVEWPDTAFRSSQSPLMICVVGEDPFGRDLDEIVKGQTIGERNIAIKRMSQWGREDSCQVVFLGLSDAEKWQRSLSGRKSALTVTEHDDFLENIVINLLVEDGRVRFGVNMDAADRIGLKISSKLLKLAKNVRERRKS